MLDLLDMRLWWGKDLGIGCRKDGTPTASPAGQAQEPRAARPGMDRSFFPWQAALKPPERRPRWASMSEGRDELKASRSAQMRHSRHASFKYGADGYGY